MLEQVIYKDFTFRIINSTISAIAVLCCVLIIYALFRKKFSYDRQKHMFRNRMIYIAILIYILIIVRIWIEGFTHLFGMLSLIAAGLVVTNKETIMNLVGWLIVNWRDLFTESDFIQIQNFTGYVNAIRPLYFEMFEISSSESGRITGRTIKVPNGLLIANPIAILPSDDSLILNRISYIVSLDANPIAVMQQAKTIIDELVKNKYKKPIHLSKLKKLSTLINLAPSVELKASHDKEKIINIDVLFYCYRQDANELEQNLQFALIKMFGSNLEVSST